MPIYEYQCETCGHQFDALRSMREADSPISCKHCQSLKTKRKLSRCFSHSSSGEVAGSSAAGGCGGCSGGSCSSCNH